MAGKDAGNPEKVEPDQNHDDEPEDKTRKSDPAGNSRAAEAQDDGKPEWKRLDDMTPYQARRSTDSRHERKNNGQRTDRDYHRRCFLFVPGGFRILPHKS